MAIAKIAQNAPEQNHTAIEGNASKTGVHNSQYLHQPVHASSVTNTKVQSKMKTHQSAPNVLSRNATVKHRSSRSKEYVTIAKIIKDHLTMNVNVVKRI